MGREFWIGLIVGLIIGWFIEWVIDWFCWRKKYQTVVDQLENKKDDFYTVSGGWDWIRVPLLKPYEVKRANPKNALIRTGKLNGITGFLTL